MQCSLNLPVHQMENNTHYTERQNQHTIQFHNESIQLTHFIKNISHKTIQLLI